MENKGKSWSRGKNSRPLFGVNLNLNLSICLYYYSQKVYNFHP